MTLLFLVQNALAQAPAAAKQSPYMSFLPLILMFVVFYFFMIRPQQRQMAKEKEFLAKLNKGDEVYTKSGVLGKIHGITEKIVTLEISEGVRVKVLRSQISGSANALFSSKEAAKS